MKFGDKVSSKARYKREFSNCYKSWVETEKPVTSGIFLGERLLQNGKMDYDSDYGWMFTPEKYFNAALVCPSHRQNPVYVPLEGLSLDGGE